MSRPNKSDYVRISCPHCYSYNVNSIVMLTEKERATTNVQIGNNQKPCLWSHHWKCNNCERVSKNCDMGWGVDRKMIKRDIAKLQKMLEADNG